MVLKKMIKSLKRVLGNSQYLSYLKKPVDDKVFLLEAGQGKHINGNVFAMLRVLERDDEYEDYVPYLVVENGAKKEAEEKLKRYSFNKARLLLRQSRDYNKILATAKYLVTDNSFPYYFYKREEQVYLNTWHGTPLKRLGRADIENSTSIGNVQKNFLSADYLLFPNDYTKRTMMSDYMIDRLYDGKTMVIDYPRNDALFQERVKDEIIKKYGLEGKRILAYMPTWRGTGRNVNVKKQLDEALNILTKIEASLDVDELLYVNFHFLIGNNLDLSGFNKIRKFPAEYETYDFLCICDTLITDYSSVMFDFAQTGREVILYIYDIEKYEAEKGFYFDIRTLPFIQAETIEELMDSIHAEQRGYQLPPEFAGRHFGKAARKTLDLICNKSVEGLCAEKWSSVNGLNLAHFGDIASGEHALLAEKYLKALPDEEKRRTVISFESPINHKSVRFLKALDDDVQYLRIVPGKLKSICDYIIVNLHVGHGWFKKAAEVYYNREYKRIFSNILPDRVPVNITDDSELYHILSSCEKKSKQENNGNNHCDCLGITARISRIRYHVTEEYVKIKCRLRVKCPERYAEPSNRVVVGNDMTYECDLGNVRKITVNSLYIVESDLTVEFKAEEINRWGIHNDIYIMIRIDDDFHKIPVLSPQRRNYFKKLMFVNKKFNCVYFFKEGIDHYRITVRGRNYTDSRIERIKIAAAWFCSLIAFWYNPIILYEKDGSRYEESASILYEKMMDDGYKNVRYILDRHYLHRESIPEKYKKYIVDRFSFKHYFDLFAAKTLISSEAIAHALEVRTASRFFRYFVEKGTKNYVFLQHGVMYMVSLDAEQRIFFNKSARRGKQRIVVSSRLEAQHFLDYTDYEQKDIYVSGLLKFDKSTQDSDADKIAVMLTWRPWEYVQGLSRFKNTGYYKMTEEIIDQVPESLKDRLIVLPHPLIAKQIEKNDDNQIWRYYKEYKDLKYDDILRKTKLLITDYSSISYDAFYRGANVIFYWKEKDECLKNYGGNAHLMLTEQLAFGQICYEKKELGESIHNGYISCQKEIYIDNYRKIVEFNDGNNTSRLIDMMKKDGLI